MCNGWLMLNMSKRTCVITEGFAKTDHTQNSNAPVYCIRLPYHTSAFTCWAEACGSFWKTSYFLYPCGFHTFLCQLVRKLRYGFGLTWTSFPFLYYWFFSAKVKDKCHIWIVLPLTFSIFFSAEPEDPGIAAFFLTALSVLLIVITIPFSLCFVIKVR